MTTTVSWPRERVWPFVTMLPLPLVLFGCAALLRLLAFAAFYFGSVLTGHGGIVDPYDSVEFDRWAWYAAQHLHAGELVDLRPKGLAGTTDIGFTYLVALEYFLVGHHPEVARILNCFLAGLTAPAAYIATRQTSLGDRVAGRAGWLVACFPLSIYWAGLDLLKDPLVWFFVSLGLLSLSARTAVGRSLLGSIAAGGAYVTRNYMGPGIGILLLVGGVIKRDWKAVAGLVAGLVVVELLLVAARFPGMTNLNPFDSSGQIAPGNGPATSVCSTGANPSPISMVGGGDCPPPISTNPADIAIRFAIGVPTELFGPGLRPLVDIAHPTLDWGMYPGLLVWLALLPFTILGFCKALVRGDRTVWSIAIFALGIWAALALIYAGHALRQREMAFPATLIFTAFGLERPLPRRWFWPAYIAFLLVIVAGLVWEAAAV